MDYFTSRVETAILEDMSTQSVHSALVEIMMKQGWRTKRISLDPGSSLVPAIVKTCNKIQEISEEEDVQENPEEIDEEVAVTLSVGTHRAMPEAQINFDQKSRSRAKPTKQIQ